MTSVVMQIEPNGSIYFDCDNHAGDRTVCEIISTLCNVLVAACWRAEIEINEEEAYKDGHVTLSIHNAPYPLVETFKTVEEVFAQVEEEYPYRLKLI